MNSNSPMRFALCALLLLTLCSLPFTIFAQTSSANLSGTVTDENGAVVPGVTVTVTDLATRLQRTATTNDAGQFVVPLLPASKYTVTLKREGFLTAEVDELILNVKDEKSLNIRLKTGDIKETVNVTSEAPLINESPAVATIIDRHFLSNLPLNGRSLQTLITLTPGVVPVPVAANGGSQGQFSVNGQRTNSNYFTIDGVSGNFSTTNFEGMGQNASGSLPTVSITGSFSNLASVDALQEFAIQTSTFAAEFGRSPGGQISLVTRSGENRYHGTLFEYLRNDKTDARDFFDTVKPPLRFNNFGGTFSGPIILPRFGEGGRSIWNGKEKTFFFFSYEGQRFVLPQPAVSTTVPSIAARTTGINGLGPPNAIAQALLKAFPIPNGADIINTTTGLPTGGAIYTTSFSNPSQSDVWGLRIDHHLTKNISLFGRYSSTPSSGRSRDTGNPSAFQTLAQNTRTITLGATELFGTKTINEIRANYSHNEGFAHFDYDGLGGGVLFPETILFPASASFLQHRFTFNPVTQVSSGGVSFGDIAKNENRQYQLIDNLSHTWGNHQLKFGGDVRYLLPITAPDDLLFATVGMTLANVYNNVVPLALVSRQAKFVSEFRTFSFYGQDTWKVNKRLTFTYGLRWEINPSPTGRGGELPVTLAAPPDLTKLDQSSLMLAPIGTPYYPTSYGKFAPRVGASYLVSERPGRELVVRGGFGVFYDLGQTQFGSITFPYSLTSVVQNIPLPVPTSAVTLPPVNFTPGPTNRGSLTVAAPGYTLPRTYQWNATAEQSLGKNQTISLAYVAAIGRELVRTRRIQLATSSATPNTYFSPNFSQVTVIDNGNESSYNALQAQFIRRLTRGLQATASYTWSHSIDNGSTDSLTNFPGFVLPASAFRGDSDFDVRHTFSTGVTYNLPAPKGNEIVGAVLRGWSLSSIVVVRSGLPYTPTVSESFPLGSVVVRPNFTGAPLYINDPTVATGRRLNPAAFDFSLPNVPLGQNGNVGRNIFRTPGFWQADIGLHRTFAIKERTKLELRWEAFNVFNHPNFLFPGRFSATRSSSGSISVPSTFGIITQTAGRAYNGGGNTGGFNPLFQNGGPRSMQFGLRLTF